MRRRRGGEEGGVERWSAEAGGGRQWGEGGEENGIDGF